MSPANGTAAGPVAFFDDRSPPGDDFLSDALAGLARRPKRLPPKYFYDAAGARLFEEICRTEEYYVTRTETALLRALGPELAELAGPGAVAVEFGSGAGTKTRLLLEALDAPCFYIAIDISRAQLLAASRKLAEGFPAVRVGAICADFSKPLALPDLDGGRRLGFLPGSTIGNFSPPESVAFLAGVRRSLGAGGRLLIGVDLKKDRRLLTRAYNDGAGRTAAFNLNILARMVRELDARLDLAGFAHEAVYNDGAGRMEMHLRSLRAQEIGLDGRRFPVAEAERIHTENSYKYDIPGFQALAERAGFAPRRVWTDSQNLFSLHWLEAGG